MSLQIPLHEAAKELGFDSEKSFKNYVSENSDLPYIIYISKRKWIVSRQLLERYFNGEFFETPKRPRGRPRVIS